MIRIGIYISTFLIALTCYGQIELKVKGASRVKYTADGKFSGVTVGSKIEFFSSGYTKVRTFSGHTKAVLSIDFSKNNELMASGSKDRTVKIWNLNTGTELRTLNGHSKEVSSLVFSYDNRLLASVGTDMKLNVWEVSDGRLRYSKTDHSKPIKAVAISPDNKYLVTAGGDKQIIVRDLHSGEIIRKWLGHTTWIRDLCINPDSKLLLSASEDGSVKVWDLITGDIVGEFKDHKGWIIDTEFSLDGKYILVASDNKNVYIYELKTGILSFKQQTKNSILSAAIHPDGKNLVIVEEYSKSVKVYDITSLKISPVFRFKDESDNNPPQIFISNPPKITNNRIRYSKDIIDIKGTAIDEAGIQGIKINGINTPFRENGNFIIKIPLSMGDNFITIEARDLNGNIALKKFIVQRKDLGGENYNPQNAKNFVLIVGINNYIHWPNLNNAVKDANDVASVLIGMYDFDYSNVTVLTDSQATRNNIYKLLRSYIEKVTPKDNLLVYFSGHGFFDELLNEGYWIPFNASLNAEGDYLPNSSIMKILENIDSQHTFLVVDACFSGSLFADRTRGYVENVEQYRSRWGLASGRLETVSDGAYGNNSPFADAFITFLKNNSKDKVTVSELVQYVKMTVAEQYNQTPIGNPLKVLGDEGGEFVFYKRTN